MRKLPLQDVVSKPDERQGLRGRSALPNAQTDTAPLRSSIYNDRSRSVSRIRRMRPIIWICALFLIAGVTFGFSFLFSGAEVLITPKDRTVFVSGSFNAIKSESVTDGVLSYTISSMTKTSSKSVPATGTEEVEEYAQGKIVVYNNFSSADQRLITNTRFETSDGLIFRIRNPIVVPGQKKDESGKTVPGSIEVTVYADEPGTKYNIGLTDFTIPGFSGSPRFEAFYARSKEPTVGGFVGARQTATPESIENARASLREELRKEITNTLTLEVTEGFVAPADGVSISFTSLPNKEGSDGVLLTEEASVSAILFSLDDLSKFVAEEAIPDFEGNPIRIMNISNASISFEKAEDDKLSFLIDGSLDFRSLVDIEQLALDMAGRDKEALSTILEGYPGVEKAEVILRPFWKGTFPDDPTSIKMTLLDAKGLEDLTQ
jgi:hypothetical protein